MSRWVKILSFALVLLCLSVCGFGQARAAIELDSLIAVVQLGPGQNYDGAFQVTNIGDRALSIEVVLKDFILDEEAAFIALEPGTMGDHSLANFITYDPSRMTLEPGESQMVRYSFTLPMEAPGPRWAALIVSPEAPEEAPIQPEGEEGVALVVRVIIKHAFIIIQRELNPPEPAGQMIGIDVSGKITEEDTHLLTVRGAFQNLCGGILVCQVFIEVRDAAGKVILRHDFPPDRMVLPNARRIFSHTFEDVDMPPGQYLILCVVDFGGDYLVAAQFLLTITAPP